MWRRRATAAVTERLALKATAVLLSVVLWFIVAAKEPTEAVVPVTFAPELDSTLVLRDPPPKIRVLAVGTQRELFQLLATPPVIRRPIAADAPDTLVIDLRPTDVTLPAGVNANDVLIRAVQPASVTLRFESTSTRIVPVRSNLRILAPTWPGPVATWLDPDRVEISGPRRVVFRIGYVPTVRATIPVNDSLPHLIDLDTARLGVRVRPAQVKARVTTIGSGSATTPPSPSRPPSPPPLP